MPQPEHKPIAISGELDDVASGWLSRHDAGLSAAERREFEQWLAADPRHAAIWAEYAAAWRTLDEARANGTAAAMLRELAARKQRRRWKVVAGAAGLAATAAAAVFIFLVRPAVTPSALPGAAQVSLLKPEEQLLEDGSVVQLNHGAAIQVDFRPEERRVRLLRGEAHFAVAKNPARPFVVQAGTVMVRAVGTAFAVKVGADAVDVLVTEGRVAVEEAGNGRSLLAADSAAAPAAEPPVLTAGQRVEVPLQRLAAPAPAPAVALASAEIERRLAWRGSSMELTGAPLAEAVAVMNRENRVQLTIADPDLAKMRMSGIFSADNAEGFVRLLEANYGVRAERRGEHSIVLHQQP